MATELPRARLSYIHPSPPNTHSSYHSYPLTSSSSSSPSYLQPRASSTNHPSTPPPSSSVPRPCRIASVALAMRTTMRSPDCCSMRRFRLRPLARHDSQHAVVPPAHHRSTCARTTCASSTMRTSSSHRRVAAWTRRARAMPSHPSHPPSTTSRSSSLRLPTTMTTTKTMTTGRSMRVVSPSRYRHPNDSIRRDDRRIRRPSRRRRPSYSVGAPSSRAWTTFCTMYIIVSLYREYRCDVLFADAIVSPSFDDDVSDNRIDDRPLTQPREGNDEHQYEYDDDPEEGRAAWGMDARDERG
jgi:hypothetical protein